MCDVGKGVYLLLPVLMGASFCADIHKVLDGVGGLVFTIHQKN